MVCASRVPFPRFPGSRVPSNSYTDCDAPSFAFRQANLGFNDRSRPYSCGDRDRYPDAISYSHTNSDSFFHPDANLDSFSCSHTNPDAFAHSDTNLGFFFHPHTIADS